MELIVKKSKIHGRGVFANKDFRKGDTVIRWDISKQLSSQEIDKIPERDKCYLVYVNNKVILQKSPAKYVNHSCNPNTKVKDFCDVAIKDIKKGEEITSDYSTSLGPNQEFLCGCKDKKCKGTIKANF